MLLTRKGAVCDVNVLSGRWDVTHRTSRLPIIGLPERRI